MLVGNLKCMLRNVGWHQEQTHHEGHQGMVLQENIKGRYGFILVLVVLERTSWLSTIAGIETTWEQLQFPFFICMWGTLAFSVIQLPGLERQPCNHEDLNSVPRTNIKVQAWWHVFAFPVLWRQRQVDPSGLWADHPSITSFKS